ncbi:hypothetical protein ACHWQZ_G019363 [Mnemiopsis leidyi]
MKMTDKENQQKGVQFQFRKRYRKVDWKLLANVDIEKITRDLDYRALQANIMNVAFCDTKSQDFLEVDEDFIKLYRLGQYTIEYLLHCQEYLSHGTVELETKLREAIRFRNEVKEKLEGKQKELTDCKKESRKRKKMIAVYQSMLNTSGVNGFHKCSHCAKAFVSAPFLASHLERRHGIVPPPVQNTEDKLRIANEELEKELQTLKDKFREIEEQLKGAQELREKSEALRDSTLQQQIQQEIAHKTWVKEMEEKHKEEIEKVKEIYLKEASDALEEKRIAELALVEAKKGIVSNLGALRDEKHEHDDLRQEQLTELETQFESKISQLQQEVEVQARKLRNTEEEHRQAIEDARQREERLLKQLEGKTMSEQKLQEILNRMEIENAKLVQMNKEKPDIRSTFSPAALAQLTNNSAVENGSNVEVVQKMLASQPVTMLQESSTPARAVPTEKRHVPFADKPYIKTYYEHPTEAIDAARRELENDIAIRLLNVTASPDIDSLTNEEYSQYKEQIDRNRIAKHTSHDIQQLEAQLTEICQRANHKGSPRGSVSASPIPTTLPPKSPSFRQSREEVKPTPGYSLRDPNYNPTELSYSDHPEVQISVSRLDEDSEDEEQEESRSPSPVVKRRPNKSYKEEDDSIFSFDGWSKMKNRNSMSADDAQQNIPSGHVAKMRQAVDELNRAKRVKTAIGVAIVPPGGECKIQKRNTCPPCIDREEEDDFTVSSLSDRDLSPVEMKVDIKRSSRNGIDDVL